MTPASPQLPFEPKYDTSPILANGPAAPAKKFKPNSPQFVQDINSVVMNYLQKRNYKAGNQLHSVGPSGSTMSLSQLALKQILRNQASDNDVVSHAVKAHDPDVSTAEVDYSKFKTWISESPDSMKPELAQLLYPVFTHLYLELVLGAKTEEAASFHNKHHMTFVGNSEFAQFIFLLTSIRDPGDMARDEVVMAFHNAKYSVMLGVKTFRHLLCFLQDSPVILVKIFRAKIDLRVAEDASGTCSKMESTQSARLYKQEMDQEEHLPSSVNEEKLRSIIKAVRDSGSSPLPCTCLYKIFGDSCCTKISPSSSILATGNDDSSVETWDLLPSDDIVNTDNPVAKLPLGDTPVYERPIHHKRAILRGHSGPIYDLSFLPNSRHLLSVSRDKTMRLWDLHDRSNVAVYYGHSYPVWCLDIDRLGVNIVTGSMDRTAKLWQVDRTYPLRIYSGHEEDVDVVQFHPNCNYFATASSDKTVRVWSHADAKMVRCMLQFPQVFM